MSAIMKATNAKGFSFTHSGNITTAQPIQIMNPIRLTITLIPSPSYPEPADRHIAQIEP
jgi:hypothetical protein